MADPEIIDVNGLQLSNNTFSASPPGSLAIADNCVITQKGVVQPRNGQDWYSTLPAPTDVPWQELEFQKNLLVSYASDKLSPYGLGYANAGTTTPYAGGPYNPVGWTGGNIDYMRLHFCLASLFVHFCCTSGPRVLEAYNSTPRRAGLSRVPDFSARPSIPTGTAAGVIPYNSSVAYRYLHKRVTSTGQVLVSPPSNRFIVTNRFTVAVGGLVRTGGNLVNVTLTPATFWNLFSIGALFNPGATTFTLQPNPTGDANFAAGSYLVNANTGLNSFNYVNVGANIASTVAVEINPGFIVAGLTIQLPNDAIAGDVIQIFRSVATSASNIEPSKDVYLVDELSLSGGDIAAGNIFYVDYTPESVLLDPLYTNPSDGDGQGELGANFPPPIYLDASNFDSKTFYLGTTGQRYLLMQMLGVGSPGGIQDGDTITIFDGVATTKVYTFKNVPAVGGDVQITSDGLPSYNIAWTLFKFIQIATLDFKALGIGFFGATSANGYPGGLRIERTDYSQTSFQVKVSRPSSWSPGFVANTYMNSFASAQPNGLVWGKNAQPEAVPAINSISANGVGVPNYYGRRCFGLRNSLIIFKDGDGIWSLTGSGGSYSLLQISNANIIAPDCACVMADCVWAYTDQGIVRVSDAGGIQTVSRQVDSQITSLASALPAETYAYSFAIPYETERRIMFYVPVDIIGSTPVMEAFCYSPATNAWTKFNHRAFCGFVSTGHQLVTGIYDTVFGMGRTTIERKTQSYLDIADAGWPNVLTTTADPLVVSLATAGAIQQGTGISQTIGGTTYRTKVSAVLGGGLYRLAETFPWTNAACTIYDPYTVEVQFLPSGTPGSRKYLSRLLMLYKDGQFRNYFGRVTLYTDQVQDKVEISTVSMGYGSKPYGVGPYGDPSPMVVDTNPIDPKWSNAGQFFPGFKLSEAWCQFKLQGLGMKLDSASGPVSRG